MGARVLACEPPSTQGWRAGGGELGQGVSPGRPPEPPSGRGGARAVCAGREGALFRRRRRRRPLLLARDAHAAGLTQVGLGGSRALGGLQRGPPG